MARPLRFCHISIFYPPYSFGGDAIALHRNANALARRGHEVDVIHCVDSYKVLAKGEPTQAFPNHPNVTVHSLRSKWGFLSPLVAQQTGSTWPKTKQILEILYSKKFDVIHYHNISLFGPKVLELQPDYGDFIKLYTTHEHWLICPMHVLWKNNERLCDKPDCLRCTLKYKRPPQWWRYTRLLDRCLLSVDQFISPSFFTRRMHIERGFRHPMTVSPYFLPAQELAPRGKEFSPHGQPYFLFVGRLEKIKGVQTLIPLFRDYKHADLLIAGTGTYEGELRRLAQGMTNVHFLGALPQEKLAGLYRNAIALLVPSICYEVLGIIILEAYLQKAPVIARDLGGLTEVVEEGGGGLLYRTDDELVAAMESLRTNSALRTELGERGYSGFWRGWSEEVHMESYFNAIDRIALRKWGKIPWAESSAESQDS